MWLYASVGVGRRTMAHRGHGRVIVCHTQQVRKEIIKEFVMRQERPQVIIPRMGHEQHDLRTGGGSSCGVDGRTGQKLRQKLGSIVKWHRGLDD